MDDFGPYSVHVRAMSNSDVLGYRGQQAVSEAAEDPSGYLIIGGHMVRLLQLIYPTPNAMPRSTIDADTALNNVETVGTITENLLDAEFTKAGGNLLIKDFGDKHRVEVNLLLARTGKGPGLRTQTVEGVGQVDTLPELTFALNNPALLVNVEAALAEYETIHYRTRIPTLETALVLKAHSWRNRRKARDVADLLTLLEIRAGHANTSWRMKEPSLIGFRQDAARALHELAGLVNRRTPRTAVPDGLNSRRLAALIATQISEPP